MKTSLPDWLIKSVHKEYKFKDLSRGYKLAIKHRKNRRSIDTIKETVAEMHEKERSFCNGFYAAWCDVNGLDVKIMGPVDEYTFSSYCATTSYRYAEECKWFAANSKEEFLDVFGSFNLPGLHKSGPST
jgi:hypothetical protein